jgi:uncharacterized protein YgbK (DUF1537 family)
MSYRALVVADDLTGAMDAGWEFAARGFATTVAIAGEDGTPARETVAEHGVLVVDTDSRSASASEAARAVESAVAAHPAAVVYLKIDSTLRGNPVLAIDAALAATDTGIAVFAPAFPATGRTTANGTHLVDGDPVTEAIDGPATPATAHLPTLLEASKYPVVTCSTERAERGPDAIGERLSEIEEPSIVVCDAESEDHLGAITRAAAAVDRRVLSVGSAGLARHVRLPDGRSADGPTAGTPRGDEPTMDGDPADPNRAGAGTVLGIAGSTNSRTIEGVAALPAEQVVALDVPRAIADPEAAASEAATDAIETLTDGGRAVVTSVSDPETIERRREADVAAGTRAGEADGASDGDGTVGERIERALATIAGEVYDARTPNGLFLTGGAVAAAVLRELDASAIRLSGEAVERGVPIGRLAGGRAEGVTIVTKAGGFGDERTIANCVARLGDL